MKIKIARYVRVYFYLGLIFGVFVFISHIVEFGLFEHWSREEVILDITLSTYGFWAAIMWLLICPRAFVVVNVQEGVISSSLFGKVKCEIKTDVEVYYVIIEANPEKIRGAGGTFIVISNKSFLYEQQKKIGCGIWKKEKLFENCYDMTQMILIPYNEKTKYIFPLEKWTNCLNGKNG